MKANITFASRDCDANEQDMVITTTGSFLVGEDAIQIMFDDHSVSPSGHLEFKISKVQVNATYDYGYRNEFCFKLHQMTEVSYRSAYGTMLFDVWTELLKIEPGEVQIRYQLTQGNKKLSTMHIRLQYKEE